MDEWKTHYLIGLEDITKPQETWIVGIIVGSISLDSLTLVWEEAVRPLSCFFNTALTKFLKLELNVVS